MGWLPEWLPSCYRVCKNAWIAFGRKGKDVARRTSLPLPYRVLCEFRIGNYRRALVEEEVTELCYRVSGKRSNPFGRKTKDVAERIGWPLPSFLSYQRQQTGVGGRGGYRVVSQQRCQVDRFSSARTTATSNVSSCFSATQSLPSSLPSFDRQLRRQRRCGRHQFAPSRL